MRFNIGNYGVIVYGRIKATPLDMKNCHACVEKSPLQYLGVAIDLAQKIAQACSGRQRYWDTTLKIMDAYSRYAFKLGFEYYYCVPRVYI